MSGSRNLHLSVSSLDGSVGNTKHATWKARWVNGGAIIDARVFGPPARCLNSQSKIDHTANHTEEWVRTGFIEVMTQAAGLHLPPVMTLFLFTLSGLTGGGAVRLGMATPSGPARCRSGDPSDAELQVLLGSLLSSTGSLCLPWQES